MSITDPIANMLTRIRNAVTAGKDKVDVKSSNINQAILGILKKEKFIQNFKLIPDQKHGMVRVYLRFEEGGAPAIHGLEKVSKPGLRIYAKHREIPKVLDGLGIAVVSTSHGLMTDEEARKNGLGGEVLCRAW